MIPMGILRTLLVMVGGISMRRVPDWGGGKAPGRGHGPASVDSYSIVLKEVKDIVSCYR